MGITGCLTPSEIKTIIGERTIPTTFIETGTYKGDSTHSAAQVFENVHTIELVDNLREQAKQKCQSFDNIAFHKGDSVQVLRTIMVDVQGQGSCMWFLDAHQSGNDTSHVNEHVPLLSEIRVILDTLDMSVSHCFVIDDVRLFSNFWDWEHVNFQVIEDIFQSKGFKMIDRSIKNDRFIFWTEPQETITI